MSVFFLLNKYGHNYFYWEYTINSLKCFCLPATASSFFLIQLISKVLLPKNKKNISVKKSIVSLETKYISSCLPEKKTFEQEKVNQFSVSSICRPCENIPHNGQTPSCVYRRHQKLCCLRRHRTLINNTKAPQWSWNRWQLITSTSIFSTMWKILMATNSRLVFGAVSSITEMNDPESFIFVFSYSILQLINLF